MVVLSVNAGSSSLKVAAFSPTDLTEPIASVAIEAVTSMTDAVRSAAAKLMNDLDVRADQIEAIGHRVVHGGQKYASATRIDHDLIKYLETIIPLAPNHLPNILIALRAFTELYPHAPHIACFDTSFFHDIPDVAKILPLPIRLQRELHIRRYGFHGLSYEYLLNSLKEHEGETARRGRVIMAHLGSGASVAACKDGKPVDMSMGFTPVSGIMMSTRSGDIEPGVLDYIRTQKDLSPDDITALVTSQSGLLGVSGTTADMYTLLQTQHENPDAKLAIDLFCSRIQKTMGGFMTVLGGVDSIIFTGGIGERSAEIRFRICQAFGYAGIAIDEHRNAGNERLISADTSSAGVHVIPAREDCSIVQHTLATLGKEAA